MKNTQQLFLEGSAQEVAGQIFERVISPVFAHMNAKSDNQADDFAFCMAGATIAGYLSASDDLEADKAKLLFYIEEMCKDILKEEQAATFEAQTMGKPA
jgi:hypothetical protein